MENTYEDDILSQKEQFYLSQDKQQQEQVRINIECCGNNRADEICLNELCQSRQIFICFDEQCRCQSQHKACKKSLLLNIIDKIKSKIIRSTQQIRQQIYIRFDELIDELSDARDKIITLIDENIKYSQLRQSQKYLISAIEQNKQPQIKQFSQISSFKALLKQQPITKCQIFDLLKLSLSQLNQPKLIIKQHLKSLVQEINHKFLNGIQQFRIANQFINQSSIIKSVQHVHQLANMFSYQWKHVKLIFKASLNQFSLKKYWETCGSQTNTIIVCKTDAQNIIGAYSPLSHQWTGKQQLQAGYGQYATDHTKTSFIFSLTNNDKFQLKRNKKAVLRYKNKDFIGFGNGQLRICDKSNQRQDNRTCLNNGVYYNQKYDQQRSNSYRKFNGNESYVFLAKQWQVWKITMKQE